MGTRNTAILLVAGIFCFSFSIYYGLTWWDSGFAGFLVGCLLFGCIVVFIVLENKFINKMGMFYGSRAAHWTRRETLESEVAQARYSKMKRDYTMALEQINAVLQQDPEFPEALFLKAQILWEGFRNAREARSTLQIILQQKSGVRHDGQTDEETVYRWASSLYAELDNAQKANDGR